VYCKTIRLISVLSLKRLFMNEEYDFVVSQPRNNFETGTKQRGV